MVVAIPTPRPPETVAAFETDRPPEPVTERAEAKVAPVWKVEDAVTVSLSVLASQMNVSPIKPTPLLKVELALTVRVVALVVPMEVPSR